METINRKKLWFMQIFATAENSTNTLTKEMQTWYDKRLIDNAEPELIHEQFAQKRPLPQGSGKKANFRKFTPLKTVKGVLTEGVTPDGDQLSVTDVEATVQQRGNFIQYTDLLDMTAMDPIKEETAVLLGDQAGRSRDAMVRDKMHEGTNVSYCGTWSGTTETSVSHRYDLDATAVLTVNAIRKAATKLKRQNAPRINGYYIGIIHPDVAEDLQRDKEWQEAAKYGNPEQLFKGEIGRIAGVRFLETTQAKIYVGANLTAAARNLTVASLSTKTITVDEAISSAEATALAGRLVLIDGKQAEIASAAAGAAGEATITLKDIPSGMAPADGDVIYPGEGGKEGRAVYGNLIIGANAYGVTDLEGGGLKMIMKQVGSSGTADPLDQRGTSGWKMTGTAELLVNEFIVRVESSGGYGENYTEEN